ncbi:MAG: GNAT family N-acetyltransferase [Novosphingobium sp.]
MAARTPLDPLDAIMAVMDRAFDPRFGEAWNRRQVADALLLGGCDHAVIGADGRFGPLCPDDAAGFFLSRAVLDEEELLLLAVDPAFRGRGLGARLLERFVAAAAARGARRLFLEMRRGNPADALYEAHGFRAIGVRPGYYRASDGTRIDALSFERSLD